MGCAAFIQLAFGSNLERIEKCASVNFESCALLLILPESLAFSQCTIVKDIMLERIYMFWGGVHTVKVRSQSCEDPKAAEEPKMGYKLEKSSCETALK